MWLVTVLAFLLTARVRAGIADDRYAASKSRKISPLKSLIDDLYATREPREMSPLKRVHDELYATREPREMSPLKSLFDELYATREPREMSPLKSLFDELYATREPKEMSSLKSLHDDLYATHEPREMSPLKSLHDDLYATREPREMSPLKSLHDDLYATREPREMSPLKSLHDDLYATREPREMSRLKSLHDDLYATREPREMSPLKSLFDDLYATREPREMSPLKSLFDKLYATREPREMSPLKSLHDDLYATREPREMSPLKSLHDDLYTTREPREMSPLKRLFDELYATREPREMSPAKSLFRETGKLDKTGNNAYGAHLDKTGNNAYGAHLTAFKTKRIIRQLKLRRLSERFFSNRTNLQNNVTGAGDLDDLDLVNITDVTAGHSRGFPARLAFLVTRGNLNVSLNLTKDKLSPKLRNYFGKSIKLYRDLERGGQYLVNLTRSNTGRYLRTLTGGFNTSDVNVHLKPLSMNTSTLKRQIKRFKGNFPVLHVLQTTIEEKRKRSNLKDAGDTDDLDLVNITDVTAGDSRGFSARLSFLVTRGNLNVSLNLTKDKLSPKMRNYFGKNIKLYRDLERGGQYLVNLTRTNTGRYLRTLTGGFNTSDVNVHLKPLSMNTSTLKRQMKRFKGNFPVLHVLQTTIEEKRKRNNLKGIKAKKNAKDIPLEREVSTLFPPPTVYLPTVNLPTSQQTPEPTTDASPVTTDINPTSGTPETCTDYYDQCPDWLEHNYNNNYRQFCEQQGYDSMCCETCRDWESEPEECVDTGYMGCSCEDLLRYGLNDDKEELCRLFDRYCCSTCTPDEDDDDDDDDDDNDNGDENDVDNDDNEDDECNDNDDNGSGDDNDDDDDDEIPSTCVDDGYSGVSCEDLLRYGTSGDLNKLCRLFTDECCRTCFGNSTSVRGGTR